MAGSDISTPIKPKVRAWRVLFSVISGGAICILATIVLVACVPGLLRIQIKDSVAIDQPE